MADGEVEEQRRQEALKLFFEYFKHLTTLSVAVAVAILAIYREGIAKEAALYVALGMFGFAVFIAVFGMLLALTQLRLGQAAFGVQIGLMGLVTGLFGGGLLTFMYVALRLPLVLLLVPVLLVVALLVLLPGRDAYRRLRAHRHG